MAATFCRVPSKSFPSSLRTVYSSSPIGSPSGSANAGLVPRVASEIAASPNAPSRRNFLLFMDSILIFSSPRKNGLFAQVSLLQKPKMGAEQKWRAQEIASGETLRRPASMRAEPSRILMGKFDERLPREHGSEKNDRGYGFFWLRFTSSLRTMASAISFI